MSNWKTPRPLENSLEVDRRKRPNQLYAAHVTELNKLVERIRVSKDGDLSVPWFDPSGAGVNSRVLMLLQDPSKIAVGKKEKGTGFVSPDNPDKTADNTTYFRNKANLRPDELVHWNIVPWAVNGRKPDFEIKKAKLYLYELIHLLPLLEVVVCMGVIATNGWNQAYPNNICITGWFPLLINSYPPIIAFTCPHPSFQSVDGKHPLVEELTPSERIEKTLANVRIILDNK